MLLQKIKLKGFLGHRGILGADGNADFVEIDFNDSSLWLIHGDNGAGKSSLWDVLTFAFFKQHRGSGRGDSTSPKHLIHENKTVIAQIEVEFELDLQNYRICGEIGKTKRGGATTNRTLYKLDNDGEEEIFQDGEAKVELWLNEHLPFSFETFTSSILLRQGEADIFLKTKAPDRKKILLKLLNLDFYEKLRDSATKKHNAQKRKVEGLSESFAELQNPTDEEIQAQNDFVETAKGELLKRIEEKDAKQTERKHAEDAAKYHGAIAKIEEQKSSDEKLFAEAEAIEKNVARFCELDKVLFRLESFWKARRTFQTEEKLLSAKNERIIELETRITKLVKEIDSKSKDESVALEHFADRKTNFGKIVEQQKDVAEKSEKLIRIETLEQKIEQEKTKLAPFRETLLQKEKTEKGFSRHEDLREGLSLLENLKGAKSNLHEAENLAQDAKEKFQTLTAKAMNVRKLAIDLKAILESKEDEKTAAQKKTEDCRNNLSRWRGKLENRNQVDGEEVCSFCGSDLTNDDAKQRLAHEHENWQSEIESLEDEEKRLLLEFERIEEELNKAKSNAENAETEARETENGIGAARSESEYAEKEFERVGRELENQTETSGEWANKLDLFVELESEFELLKDAPTRKQTLETALKLENAVNLTVSIHQENLNELPSFSDAERQNIKNDVREIEQKVSGLETERNAAEKTLDEIRSEFTNLNNQKIGWDSELQSNRIEIVEAENRTKRANIDFENAFAEIPFDWQKHKAIDDETELKALGIEKENLCLAEAKAEGLKDAFKRGEQFKGELKRLQKQLDEIPTEHQRIVAEVEKELIEITQAIDLKNDEITQSTRNCEEMKRQKTVCEKLLKERKQEERQSNLRGKLAEAFGKKGLQAQIVQSAQEKVKSLANDTLKKLTNGDFEIELEDISEAEELNIYVRDWRTESLRLFELFSGGERLLLAVSLAVAIGQAAHGKNAANTLIIDEGFGALDESKRDLMTMELTRLSDVLEGARVIVVSHQNDVIEKFPNRYQIGKDEQGFTEIRRN